MTELGFHGKVAIVTGAGGGLGQQHARLLASRGAHVVVNDIGVSVTGESPDNSPAEAVAQEIRDQGGEAIADTTSIVSAEGGQALVQKALDNYGRIDIVVNNAGILCDADFDDMTEERLDPLIDVHLKGTFFVTRPAWIAMRKQGYGRVVNTTSAAGLLGTAKKSNYGAVKGGILGLTKVLAAEGAPHNIKVNAVAPFAMTRMLTHSMDSAGDAADLDPAVMEMMQGFMRKLDPALVSPVVAYLAHDECTVSGEIYTVGGGQVSQFFIGRTAGYFNPRLSIEDVRNHLDQIRDPAGHTIPADPGDETAQLFQAIATGSTAAPG
ncbi:NAD(P)-dependent dehydrogenase (short-subunit alcohol dehydrogenase family) [Mycolicibacterium sp. BK556]|uniref:SDR family NAD(P)-dependent oxidoreductase n=1 Tax=Mycobacteriaceae TaxID=1762 RepID=UPI000D3A830C|nr:MULTISPECIES: SDR family NAD(P)-dependent oxidoreductase [Mycobacteriaceae]MBB3606539.1 NAD(P)-dependent dehydrogenase (short-subunit alcohol dehydrogenase family) [Mycolicibacterium sp. BK556]MBB3636215.1 NAD(P)-dependent dehydrogenase (short-subunit alcohol dehydrogenase family) [Mycolicibacterium sp. BK607]MBB3753507.1 NAD(P)-dependent dehydrogenase (short-subunit alcohol dehydrogenase family) [Mycolicibacterium sp. BK634]TDO06359.1 NAD(P)-dependent dehydrogenase (short-subunit alcohol de